LLGSCCSSDGQDVPPEERILFKGVESLDESVLRDRIAADVRRYDADPTAPALDDAVYRIEYQYRLEGFDRVHVLWRVEGANITFEVEEGPRIRLGQVHFDGATVFDNEELKQLVPGRFLGEPPPYSLRLLLL